jgi:hypothetical protein
MKITEYNCTTGKEITRNATTEEIAQGEADAQVMQVEAQIEAEKLVARAALFNRLGITEAEARLLLS